MMIGEKPSIGALDVESRKLFSQSKVLTIDGDEVVVGDLIGGDGDL